MINSSKLIAKRTAKLSSKDEKSNCIVKFGIKGDFNDKDVLEKQCENCSCKARVVKDHELLDQSKTMSIEADQLSVSEKEKASVFTGTGRRKL